MEILKWIGSGLLAILGVSVIIAGVVVVSLFGTVLWIAGAVILVVVVLAAAIKEAFD